MSYDLATRRSEEIEKRRFKAIIADEAHYLKSKRSQRSQVLMPILIKAKRVVLISGTPMLSRPVELFNLCKILRPDIFQSFHAYAQRYCAPKEGRYGMDYTGSTCLNELHYLLSQQLMIRRLKTDVLAELPAKRRQNIEVSVDQKVLKEVKKLLSKV